MLCAPLPTDLYFLIQWCDTDDVLYDAIPARDVIPSEKGKDLLDLHPGDECKASFFNTLYPAKVLAVGKFYWSKEVSVNLVGCDPCWEWHSIILSLCGRECVCA